jgi:hypothetical protein
MACCADKAQDEADACCASEENQQGSDRFGTVSAAALPAPAVVAFAIAAIVPVPSSVAFDITSHTTQPSDSDRHVRLSVFLI